jgi:hypothetical protein
VIGRVDAVVATGMVSANGCTGSDEDETEAGAAGARLACVPSVGAEAAGMQSLDVPIVGVHAQGATSSFGGVTVGLGGAQTGCEGLVGLSGRWGAGLGLAKGNRGLVG